MDCSHRSHLSTVRRLGEDAAAQEAVAHSSTIAEMDAAISGLNEWQRKRDLEIAKLKRELIKKEGVSSSDVSGEHTSSALFDDQHFIMPKDKESEMKEFSNNGHEEIFTVESVSASATDGHASMATKSFSDPDDEDPVSQAYEDRLRAELASLEKRRKKLEAEALTPQGPSYGQREKKHHMPVGLLISEDKIKELTNDNRSHVGSKSLVALRDELRDLEAAAFDKKLRSSENFTKPEMLDETDVKRAAIEEHGFTEVFGLGDALSDYMSGLDDVMLKLDAVDAAVESSQLSSRSRREEDEEVFDKPSTMISLTKDPQSVSLPSTLKKTLESSVGGEVEVPESL